MKLKLFSVVILSVLILMGCQGLNNNEGTNDRDNNIEQTRFNDNDNNNRNRINERNNRMNETNRNNRMNNRDNMNNNQNVENDNRYEVSKEAADRITDEIDEIDQAYVLTTDNNAYVVAVLDNDQNNNATGLNNNDRTRTSNVNDGGNNNGDTGHEVTDEVKKKISDIVQSVDNDIDNVYVTTNPDFMDLTNDYVNDVNDGKPIRGFFDQIGNMIERVFPQDKR